MFDCCPDEIILAIVYNLGPKDVCILSTTCKRLLSICRDDNYWRELYNERFPGLTINSNLSPFSYFALEITNPTLTTVPLIQSYIRNIFNLHIAYEEEWNGYLKSVNREEFIERYINKLLMWFMSHKDHDGNSMIWRDEYDNLRMYNCYTLNLSVIEFIRMFILFYLNLRFTGCDNCDLEINDEVNLLFGNRVKFVIGKAPFAHNICDTINPDELYILFLQECPLARAFYIVHTTTSYIYELGKHIYQQ